MKLTLTSLAGINESIAGTDVWSIRTTLLGKETYSYYWDSQASNITINITSRFSSAWEKFFNDTLSRGGGNYNVSKSGGTLSIDISNVKELEINYAIITVKLSGT